LFVIIGFHILTPFRAVTPLLPFCIWFPKTVSDALKNGH
jgi:hypothetical protein